jgi:isopentenyl-diphosphate delta-isomerase type 1
MAETLQSEMLDTVDDNDNVIEPRTRGEVHRLKLMHRSVHVLVFDSGNRLLLQKRSMLKDECPGMWDSSCAGHVESGQSYDETAPRELEEELGFIATSPLQPLFKMQPTDQNGREFAMIYQTVFDGPFVVAEDEVDEVQWFTAEEVDQWVRNAVVDNAGGNSDSGSLPLASGFCEIWQRYRATVV